MQKYFEDKFILLYRYVLFKIACIVHYKRRILRACIILSEPENRLYFAKYSQVKIKAVITVIFIQFLTSKYKSHQKNFSPFTAYLK